jgi:RNA polymerase sigma factor (sigma-70 family)
MSPEQETGATHITPAELIQSDETVQRALEIEVEPQEFRIGVKISIFNAEMRRLREAKGLTQKELSLKLRARGVKCHEQTAGQVERFWRYPNQELAAAIADELGTDPETLFPSWLEGWLKLQQKERKRTIYFEESVTPETIRLIQARREEGYYALPAPTEQDPEKAITLELLREELTEMIPFLTKKQREVIKGRFWDDLTLDQIGQRTGKTGEGVRLVEAAALRRLRQPKFSKRLKDFLSE